MQLLSVNRSTVQTIEHQGRKIPSGIMKQPAAGDVRIDRLNVEGDEQADHVNHGGEEKAVYGFGWQHYAYWSRVLDRRDLTAGFFGENLTIDGLDEGELHVGDRLLVGSVVLQITQPRVPCFKLGVKSGQEQLPRQFAWHGLTGMYFRVLETGTVAAGDSVSVEPAGVSVCSLATLFAAVNDPASPERREVMHDALDNPALSAEWRELIEQRLQRLPA